MSGGRSLGKNGKASKVGERERSWGGGIYIGWSGSPPQESDILEDPWRNGGSHLDIWKKRLLAEGASRTKSPGPSV